MTPIDLPPRKYGHLGHDMFGWYVKADMADDQVAEWWGEALEANHNKERQLKLAHAILDRCPEHIGALTIVGYCCDSLPERLVILRQAVLIGTRVWGKALNGEIEVHWWDELGTRNYMRAIAAYAATLREAGFHAEADRCFATFNWMKRGGHLTQSAFKDDAEQTEAKDRNADSVLGIR